MCLSKVDALSQINFESSSPATPVTRDHSLGNGSEKSESSWQVASGRIVERRLGRERRRVRGDGLLRGVARTDSLPGEAGSGLGNQDAAGTSRRGNPHTGMGRKAATVRRRGGPGDPDFGRGGTGTGSLDEWSLRWSGHGDGSGAWGGAGSRTTSFGRGSGGLAARVAVSAAVRRGVDRESSERALAPRVSCDTHHWYAAHGRAPGSWVFGPIDRKPASGSREQNPRGVSG